MGLKQDLVVVNEYTVKTPDAPKGSRGGTPGEYVTRYMARPRATETLSPILRQRTDEYIMRYMAREVATERVKTSIGDLKREFADAQGEGGVAFGYGQVSLADEELKGASADLQQLFDDGHTVLKTVISFDQDYLRRRGIVAEDFIVEERGDYRGHIDQMKLRLAVMNGLRRMGNANYDDLRYVAVIQVDTEHVHCHLAMADAGKGTLAADGTQKGKISADSVSLLRRGIDSFLDEKQKVAHLSSSVGIERRNVTGFVKRWAHQQVLNEGLPQFLLACLPVDRRLWRASSNHASMTKPNRVVRLLVDEILAAADSPLNGALAAVAEYARERQVLEDLTSAERVVLEERGREQIIERAVNGVYGVLKAMPEDVLEIRTPMLTAMSMDYDELVDRARERAAAGVSVPDNEDLIGFSMRLRSYSTRLNKHTRTREIYRERVSSWEAASQAGAVAPESRALYEFYLEEEQYHAMVAAKYRNFIQTVPQLNQWYTDWEKVSDYGDRLLSLQALRKDDSIRKMKDPGAAEILGQAIYNQAGGAMLAMTGAEGDAGRLVIDGRIERMRASYLRQIEDLRVKLSGEGLVLSVTEKEDEPDVAQVKPGVEFDFNEVKGLDLHHLNYDFMEDVQVGQRALSAYQERAALRLEKLEGAMEYLFASGQDAAVSELPVADVTTMFRVAQQMGSAERPVLVSKLAELTRQRERVRRSRTITLDIRLSDELAQQVSEEVSGEIEFYHQARVGLSAPAQVDRSLE